MDKDKIKVWYDEKEDILYLSFKEGPALDSEEIDENIRLEYGKEGNVIGVEIWNVAKMVAKNLTRELQEVGKYAKGGLI